MRTVAAIAIVAIVIVAAVVTFLTLTPHATSDVTLFDTGNVQGTGDTTVTGGTVPGTQPPPGATPPPSGPPPPAANPIGTYSIYATVVFADGTSTAVTGQQGFATTPYYNGKPIATFTYTGRFTASQDVILPAGSGQHTKLEASDTGGKFDRVWDPNTPVSVKKGESKVVLNATLPATDVFGPTYPVGTYKLIWSGYLEFIYSKNGTHSPRFILQSPVLTVDVKDVPSGGGGGGGGARPVVLSIVDPRVWATYLRGA